MELRRAQRVQTTRVSTRLVAIVLVPLVGFAVSAHAEARDRWRSADRAEQLKAHVEQVSTALPIGLLLSREVYLVGALAVGEKRGLSPATVDALLGFDVGASLRGIRAEMARGLDRLPEGHPVRRFRPAIDAARTAAEGDQSPADELAEIAGAVNAYGFEALREVEERSLGLDGAAEAERSLAVLRAANAAAAAAFDQLGVLVPLVVSPDGDSAARLAELRTALAFGTVAEQELQRLAQGAVAAELQELQGSFGARTNATEIAALARSQPDSLPQLGPSELAGLFGRGIERLSDYYDLVARAAGEAADSAQRARDRAMAQLRTTLAVTALLFTATLAVTAVIARSIARPLRRLAAGAEDVRAGHLDVPFPTTGPRELRAVTAALREVVGNLRLVEAHVGALAAGELDDAALRVRVPGRLGSLLHDSVSRLSKSMSEQDELAARLQREATHDALTALPNRSAAGAHLDEVLSSGVDDAALVAALYVDLDGFKQVNDAYGHDTGDIVLQVTAARLLAGIRDGDFVARIGGDEFLVVTSGTCEAAELRSLGERLIAAVSAPIRVGSVTVRVGASVGIASSCGDTADREALLRDADIAAYQAKAAGRGRVELFDDELRGELHRATELEMALRTALVEEELRLHYQPVFAADDLRPMTLEALLRWERPGVGPVSPAEFIPVAEQSDLVVEVDRWVLDRACAQLAAWEGDVLLGDVSVAVNLSGRHLLNLTCVDDVRDALIRHGVEPHRLTVEITETVLLADVALTAEHLQQLRELGVRVAIDDFGTGYTALSHLGVLPADVLKIDMSLVRAAPNSAQAQVLTLLVGTAHALGLSVTAEGVETPEQFERMRALGCDDLQGFHLAKPAPAESLPTVLFSASVGALPR